MDTDHLSLIEMSGEGEDDDDDGSLLCNTPQIPNDDVFFACSPLLHLPRSRPRPRPSPTMSAIAEEEDAEGSDSSPKDSTNKENAGSMNKSEAAKLSVEPQAMKRKKKGGGYNLRKSLAWNRAFFTEEGVLDPLELSMLSGNVGTSSLQQGGESMSSGLDRDGASDSPDLQSLEDKLFNQVPASARKEGRKAVTMLSPKPSPSPSPSPAKEKLGSASKAKRKVLVAHDINRSASKRIGCTRPPVAPSSPASVSSTNVGAKDLKGSKLLSSKPGSSTVSSAFRSSISNVSQSKNNQIAKSAVNAQKIPGLKGISSSIGSAKNDMKSAPKGKLIKRPAVQQARRNVVQAISVPETRSSDGIQNHQVSRATRGSEAVRETVLRATMHPPNGKDGNSSKVAVSFSQDASYNGGNTQYQLPQTAKPSGLRMPSPSLGFFGQSKPSASPSLLQKNTQPSILPKSNIPKLSLHALNPIHTQTSCGKVPAFSKVGLPDASIINPSSHGKTNSSFLSKNMEKAEKQVPYNSKNHSTTNYQEQLDGTYDNVREQSLGPPEPCKVENSSQEVRLVPSNDSKLFSQSNSCEKLKKDDDGEMDTHVCQKSEDFGVASGCDGSESVVVNDSISSKVQEQSLPTHEVIEQAGDLAKLIKPDICDADTLSILESSRQLVQTSTFVRDCRYPDKFERYNNGYADLKGQEGDDSNYETSEGTSHCKDDTNGIDQLSGVLPKGYSELQSLADNLLVESGRNAFRTSVVDDSHLMLIDDLSEKSAEQTEPHNPCHVSQQSFEDNSGLHSADYLLQSKSLCSDESQGKNPLQSKASVVSERTNSCGVVLESSSIVSAMPVSQDYAFYISGREFQIVDNDSTACMESVRASSSETEGMGEDDMVEAVTVHGTGAIRTSMDTGHFICSEPEKPQVVFQLRPVVQVAVAPTGTDDRTDQNGVLDKHVSASDHDPCYNGTGSSMLHNEYSCSIEDVDQRSLNQAKLINSFTDETVKRNQSQDANGELSLMKREYLEDSWESIDRSTAEASVGASSSAHAFYQYEVMEQVNGLAGGNNMINEMPSGNPQDCTYCGPLGDGCSSNGGKSAVTSDEITGQPGGHSELHNSDIQTSQLPLHYHGLLSVDNAALINVLSAASQENVYANVLDEECSGASTETKDSDICIDLPCANQDAGVDVDRTSEYPSASDVTSVPLKTGISVENAERNLAVKYSNGGELGDQARALEEGSFSEKDGELISVRSNICDSMDLSSSNEELDLTGETGQMSRENMKPGVAHLPETNILTEESEINTLQNNSDPDSQLQYEFENVTYPTKDGNATVSPTSETDHKQEARAIKPPANVVPFSDEWLAAFEAAGEEILTMKGGAVQNSPPDKPQHEPGPWSPVKRKNNQGIGPFDCTKFTNPSIPPSTSN